MGAKRKGVKWLGFLDSAGGFKVLGGVWGYDATGAENVNASGFGLG